MVWITLSPSFRGSYSPGKSTTTEKECSEFFEALGSISSGKTLQDTGALRYLDRMRNSNGRLT